MTGSYVPPVRTPVDHEELRASLGRAWKGVLTENPPSVALAILLSQSAVETDEWNSCWNWNLGGVKSLGDGLHTFLATLEVLSREDAEAVRARSTPERPCEFAQDDGGELVTVRFRPRHPYSRFRAYESLDASAHAWVSLLARRYSTAIAAAREGKVERFVHELRLHNYFTASEAKYRWRVKSLFDEFRESCLHDRNEIVVALGLVGFNAEPDLMNAVCRFQKAHACRIDGIVGPQTRAALRKALAERAPPDGQPPT